jgi:hypothetical protein
VFEFTSVEPVCSGRGVVYVVANPVECGDFKHLIGKYVRCDGEVRKVLNVERFAHSPPWRAGERICLLLERKQDV